MSTSNDNNEKATVKCPYCNEEIDTNLKICPYCGENLKTNLKFKYNKDVLSISLFVFLIAILIFSLSLITLNYENKSYEKFVNNIKSIETLNITDFTQLYDLLTEVSKEGNDLKKYLSELHLKSNKDKAFLAYFKKLFTTIEIFNEVNEQSYYGLGYYISTANPFLNEGKPDYLGHDPKKYIKIIPVMEKAHDKYYGDYDFIKEVKIAKPEVPFLKLLYSGEGVFVAGCNYDYISNTYSKYLSKAWQNYLTIKQKEEKDLKGGTYYQDGALNPSMKTLINWIIDWRNFLDNNNKFILNDEINQALKTYTADFMFNTYQTFDFNEEKLLPQAREAYEEFLKKVNPKTKEYEAVNKCYFSLKTHNFKLNEDFKSCVENYVDDNNS